MSSKEIVRQKYPNSFAKKQVNSINKGDKQVRWLIVSAFGSYNPDILSEGKTESNAWVIAKNNLCD